MSRPKNVNPPCDLYIYCSLLCPGLLALWPSVHCCACGPGLDPCWTPLLLVHCCAQIAALWPLTYLLYHITASSFLCPDCHPKSLNLITLAPYYCLSLVLLELLPFDSGLNHCCTILTFTVPGLLPCDHDLNHCCNSCCLLLDVPVVPPCDFAIPDLWAYPFDILFNEESLSQKVLNYSWKKSTKPEHGTKPYWGQWEPNLTPLNYIFLLGSVCKERGLGSWLMWMAK